MITLNNIIKEYQIPVIAQLSYSFEEGKIYVLKGISGCGKTSLLNIIGGIDRDFSGEYEYCHKKVNDMSVKEQEEMRRDFGYIYQKSLLIGKLNIMENLLIIRQDKSLIYYLAKELGVDSLMYKYPEELSGGERQLIAIIRALLCKPKVILADEPTASLDYNRSIKVANEFLKLKSEKRIIIIATHEKCFDHIADEIIDLAYGKICKIENNIPEKVNSIHEQSEEVGTSVQVLMKVAFKRNRSHYRLRSCIGLTIIIVALLLGISIHNNLQEEYIKRVAEEVPATVFSVTKQEYDLLQENYNILLYKNYRYDSDVVEGYPLFEKSDSGLSYGTVIAFGEFPKIEEEVLINQAYLDILLPNMEPQKSIGISFQIHSEVFVISGIIKEVDNDEEDDLIYSNSYYERNDLPHVYIPYSRIKDIGVSESSNQYMIKFEGLYSTLVKAKTVRVLLEKNILSVWDKGIVDIQSYVENFFILIMFIIVLISIVAFAFIYNEIIEELFYRRKELGYLQLFGVSRRSIYVMIMMEKLIKALISSVYAIVAFIGIVIISRILFDIDLSIQMIKVLGLISIIVVYVISVVIVPCFRFMKKDILDLIR